MIKNPFAYSIDLKKVVEVSAVRKGRACQCQCLTCGQAVVAKKGDVKEWHFAHDSNPDLGPSRECETSFLASCRQFIIGAALTGEITALSTPPYIQYEEEITRGSPLDELKWEQGVTNFDLTTCIKGSKLHIYFSYPGRDNPVLPPVLGKDGFLEIPISRIERAIDQKIADGRNILSQAKELLLDNDQHVWLFHPMANSNQVKLAKERYDRKKQNSERSSNTPEVSQDASTTDQVYSLNRSNYPTESMLQLNGEITSYPKGYTGLTGREKEIIRHYPDRFTELLDQYITNGSTEGKATIKAAATLMLEIQRLKPRKK